MAKPASFNAHIKALRDSAARFDAGSQRARAACLQALSSCALPKSFVTVEYHETLLFLCTHPASDAELLASERELARVIRFFRTEGVEFGERFDVSGLPYNVSTVRYSHDCVRWLLSHPQCRVAFDSFADDGLPLNAALRLTLPSIERGETTAGLDNAELLQALAVRDDDRLSFLVEQFSKFDADPLVKDHLFDALGLYVQITPRDKTLSRAYNRLPVKRVFHHDALLRKFDYVGVLNAPLPPADVFDADEKIDAIRVTRNAMLLTDRETDPATYLDENTFEVFTLDRGIAVAVFGMVPNRQLPLESYVGFTLFKNGFPAAYGGAWLLGRHARFGMNIFEAFRGGESGYMMCQTLRTYRQAIGIDTFEVEPTMYGLDNPEGITTGAFWFYFKHGFRPVDEKLHALSLSEHKKSQQPGGHHSSEATLLRFTESNLALSLGPAGAVAPSDVFAITARIAKLIRHKFGGHRAQATDDCIAALRAKVALPSALSSDEQQVAAELALLCAALDVTDGERLDLLRQMVAAKPRNLHRYQALLTSFLDRSQTT